jgi:tRNA U34 5-carboxymethylaminomethyl modifying enzyme MnmG/GidA
MEDEALVLDPQMDYHAVTGLSSEVRERLFAVRPTTIVDSFFLPFLSSTNLYAIRVLRNGWKA